MVELHYLVLIIFGAACFAFGYLIHDNTADVNCKCEENIFYKKEPPIASSEEEEGLPLDDRKHG